MRMAGGMFMPNKENLRSGYFRAVFYLKEDCSIKQNGNTLLKVYGLQTLQGRYPAERASSRVEK